VASSQPGAGCAVGSVADAGKPLKRSPLLCVDCSELQPSLLRPLEHQHHRPAVLPAPVPLPLPLPLPVHTSASSALVCAVTSAPRSPTQGWRRRRGESAPSRLLKHRRSCLPSALRSQPQTRPPHLHRLLLSNAAASCPPHTLFVPRHRSLARSPAHRLHFPVVSAALVTAASPRSLRTTKRLGFQHISISPAPSPGPPLRFQHTTLWPALHTLCCNRSLYAPRPTSSARVLPPHSPCVCDIPKAQRQTTAPR
jgi:hypothetical protein